MQETIRTFRKWLTKSHKNYQEELDAAHSLFWEEREDVEPIEYNQDTEMFFNEWLMLDFPVNGFDNIPARERVNFINVFLKENKSRLSKSAQIFAKNASESFLSFYKVVDVKPEEYTNLKDLFFGNQIRSVDINLSRGACIGQIICGRFCQNEKGKYIAAGSQNITIPEKLFEILSRLIRGTYQLTINSGEEIKFEEFLKWNSYIYYREITAAKERRGDLF